MPENPLLPHRKLQELHMLMQRCRALDLKQKRAKPARSPLFAREAFLAATSIHLLPGDLLCAEPGDRTPEQIAPAPKDTASAASSLLTAPNHSHSPRFLLCAAAARGLQAAGSESIALAYASAGPASAANAGWVAALEWAHAAQLPLLLACAGPMDPPARRARPPKSTAPSLDWASMSRLATRLRLPLLPVDGEDAVAVFRVMQESVLRARSGGGPAVLWAMMTSASAANPAGLPRARQPLARLKSYLAARRITLPG